MIKTFSIFLFATMFMSCENKQWNLNKTIGWESMNPEDYTVLYLKWNSLNNDSIQLKLKSKLDNQILEDLRLQKLGDEVEKDDSTETDLHFLVRKDYKKTLTAIVSVIKLNKISEFIIVYERQYTSWDKWNDEAIYTLEKPCK